MTGHTAGAVTTREAGAPLGTTTNFAAALPAGRVRNAETVEEDKARRRLDRYRLQSFAAELLPGERVGFCLRHRLPGHDRVSVNYSQAIKRAHYGNLMVCGSVWTCPVCAAKITEKRRKELLTAKTDGLNCFMVTFTFQHFRGDSLKDLYAYLSEAMRRIKSGRPWRSFTARWQVVGSVAGTEITYGVESGWHPHKHVLFWTMAEYIDTEAIQAELHSLFGGVLANMGRYSHPVHGVDVRKGDNLAAEYLAKFGRESKGWSLESEITKAPVKLAAGEHYTPFQLLALYADGDKQAGELFQEYAAAMKGASQLRWSPGTRKLLGLGTEQSDQELAEAQEEQAVVLAWIPADGWRIICAKNYRGPLLEVASLGDVRILQMCLAAIGVTLEYP